MISFDEFLPDLEPDLPMCPIPVIERRLRDAIIEACEDASVWRFEAPEIQLIAGQEEYDIPVPTIDDVPVADVHSILSVSRTSNRRHPCLVPGRDYMVDMRGSVIVAGVPIADSADTTDPAAPGERGLFVHCTLKPTRTSTHVGEEVLRNYHKLVIQGALSKAYAMKGQPWSNPAESREHRKIFERELGAVRRATEQGFITASHRMPARRFAASSQRGY